MVDYKDRLSGAMLDAELSISELASKMEASYQAVKKVVEGKSGSFSASNNSIAAKILNVSPDWLATGEGSPDPLCRWPFQSFSEQEYFSVEPSIRQEVEDRLLGAITRAKREEEKARKQG